MTGKTKVTFVRLPIDQHQEVVKLAKDESRTIVNMLMVLVKEALDARKRRE
jgi:hypothetical protein